MKIFSLMLVFASVMPCAAQSPAYTVDDVGTLGGLSSTAAAVNNKGQVVGTSDLEDGKHAHAFFFDGSHILDMGTLGGSDSEATSLNDDGQTVGEIKMKQDTFSYPFVAKQGTVSHPFMWQNGKMSLLEMINFLPGTANAINNVGHIAGGIGEPYQHGFALRAGVRSGKKATSFGALGGDFSEATAINSKGEVAGFSDIAGHKDTHAFLGTDGKLIDLGTLGGGSSYSFGINNAEQIVGSAYLVGNRSSHAFLWQGGQITDLGTLGSINSQANAINNKGQIVGWSDASDQKSQHAFLYDKGKMTDLNTLIDHKYGWVLLEATGISDTGYICGTGIVDGVQHAFRLTPISAASK